MFLLSFITTSKSQEHSIGIKQETYSQETDSLIEIAYLDSYVIYTSDAEYNTIWMTEYDVNGKVLKKIMMSVIKKSEDEVVITFDIKGGEYNYQLLFWKDGSMVVYRFPETYVILTGEIQY